MMNIRQTARNVLVVLIDGISAGWEHWVLLTSDRHHDNIHCRRDREKRDLELAKERNAQIADFGDLFCAMQGKYDPRSDMSDIRPEDVGTDYLDRIVNHAADFYEPYAKNFLLLGHGNHETNVLKRHGTNLTSNLVHDLNRMGGSVYTGWYSGWIWFQFGIQKTVRQSFRLHYHHGTGGNAPVTRGVIQTNRQSVYLPDADAVVSGHSHDSWYVPIRRVRLSQKGKVMKDLIHHIRTPGYKDAYNDGAEGFEVEKGLSPKPIGCAWLRFYYEDGRIESSVIVDVEG